MAAAGSESRKIPKCMTLLGERETDRLLVGSLLPPAHGFVEPDPFEAVLQELHEWAEHVQLGAPLHG
jgi:hypothetical protein